MSILIKNATIINRGQSFRGSVFIQDRIIDKIFTEDQPLPSADRIIEAEGLYLLPGVIDDQVHFREPGLTHKADIATESKAAIAGGVTSFMEMPNTKPQTTTIDALNRKFEIAAEKSYANYSFYLGATNDNLQELLKADPRKTCGVKVFMGSSTGNMLVDNRETLQNIFKEVPMLIATHCEDENTIRANIEQYRNLHGEKIPFRFHPQIRSAEACYRSSSLAVDLATRYHARLHILHVSTARELSLFSPASLQEKHITAEVCVHHLWFTDEDYNRYGSRIKWNPAVKSREDREALREGLKNHLLDVVATDHAPHALEEKNNDYFQCPSGGPLVEHSLIVMLEMAQQGVFSTEMVVEKMCHAPAQLFQIEKRGFINEGYYADLVLVAPHQKNTISDESVLYKCQWSPFSGTTFSHRVTHTIINGHVAYENGEINPERAAMPLTFNR